MASEAPRRVDAANEDDSRLTRFRRRGVWRVLLGFHVEVRVIVTAGIGQVGCVELIAHDKHDAEKEYCHRLFHVGIS
jgi:hypothetical protein